MHQLKCFFVSWVLLLLTQVEKWPGDIRSYKNMMKKKMGLLH